MTEAKEGTETTRRTITSTSRTMGIIMDGIGTKGIPTETDTSIAEVIAAGIGITVGIVIGIGVTIIGNTTGIAITGGAITTNEWWKSTFIIIIPNVIVTTTTAPASLSR